MLKKTGWLWILGAIFLLIADFFILGNKSFITAKWADVTASIIGFVVCPLLILIGIFILIMGKSK